MHAWQRSLYRPTVTALQNKFQLPSNGNMNGNSWILGKFAIFWEWNNGPRLLFKDVYGLWRCRRVGQIQRIPGGRPFRSQPRTSLFQRLLDDCACVMSDGFWDAVDVDEVIINFGVSSDMWDYNRNDLHDARYCSVVCIMRHFENWFACVVFLAFIIWFVTDGWRGGVSRSSTVFLCIICLRQGWKNLGFLEFFLVFRFFLGF